MINKIPKLFTALALLILGSAAIVVFAPRGDIFLAKEAGKAKPAPVPADPKSSASYQVASLPGATSPIASSSTGQSNGASTISPVNSLQSTTRELAPLMATPISLRDGETARQFQLSTTEVSLRGLDGAQKIVSLPSSDAPETFAAALEKLRTEEGVEPELVLYAVGFPQNEFTRRIATRQVVITAPSRAEADALASAQGLLFKKAPVFAPNSFVYEAPTSAKALSVQANSSTALEATPLLASRAAKKTMPNDPYIQLQWHLKYQGQLGAVQGADINVESVWNYPSTNSSNSIRGRGVVIGIVDDGMEWNHPDLRPNVLPELQWDWNGNDNDPTPNYAGATLEDKKSHGTACGGVAAARGNNRIGVSGVAPEASLVGMRLIDGYMTDLDVAEAMTWKIGEIDILSNSWGPDDDGVTLFALNHLTKNSLKYACDFGRGGKGTIITWSGGNGRENLDDSNYDEYSNSIYTIAVGAIDSQMTQASYSEPGANLVITAPSLGAPPSLGIMTTDNRGLFGENPGFQLFDFANSGDVTQNFRGTSASCPVVSGVVALMLEKNPDLGWRDVQEILIRSAKLVDASDPDWITANRSSHISGAPPVPFKFNHKYGAGLVDADAAMILSGNWTNLSAQTSASVSSNTSTAIDASGGPNATITRTFTVPTSLRTEHVTLALNIPGIKKGRLQINLTSPAGTNSVFCEPHSDTDTVNGNEFENWTFMTVRNWGENSSGNWTLTITNSGNATGNLTASTLTVFGTQTPALSNPLPVVSLKPSRSTAFLGTAITINATAIDKNSDNTLATISKIEFFSNNGSGPVSIGNSTSTSGNNTYSVPWSPPAAGTYTLTATATDGATPSASATSVPVTIRVDKYPVAAWDFDTPAQSVVPLATAIQSSRQYTANFGSNNATYAKILLDGSRGSSLWSVSNGELWTGTGSALNFLADANPFGTNIALLLRGGKNLSSNNKYIVFEIDMTNARRLEISYAAQATTGGFATHEWDYWDDIAKTWRPITDPEDNTQIPIPTTFTTIVLDQVGGAGFNNRANARVRLKVSGATAISGTNLLDNIRFNATVAP